MSAPISLGRIWTVPIQGTRSLVALVLIVAGLAAWQLRSIIHGYSLVAYAAAGLFSAALFIWTIFAHESAHVVAARHYGARVKGVTLSLLGGETAISGQPGSPWQGVAVATSGPGVSVLCGVACVAGGFATQAAHLPTLVAVSFGWVGLLSLMLAAANMIPAAPLDGGHVLQAFIWAATGNRVRASIVAGFMGQVVGAAMVGLGIWLAAYDQSFFAAVAMGIVGWPLWRGAVATRRVARQRQLLGGTAVAELMRGDVALVPADKPVADAADWLAGRAENYLAVVDDAGRPRGVLTAADVLEAARLEPGQPMSRLVRRQRQHVTSAPDEPVADALERTRGKPTAVLVVVDDQVRGVLDPDDVRRALRQPRAGDHRSALPDTDVWPGARH